MPEEQLDVANAILFAAKLQALVHYQRHGQGGVTLIEGSQLQTQHVTQALTQLGGGAETSEREKEHLKMVTSKLAAHVLSPDAADKLWFISYDNGKNGMHVWNCSIDETIALQNQLDRKIAGEIISAFAHGFRVRRLLAQS